MEIRKISVGVDYKNAMHYVVGQEVLRGSGYIYQIQIDDGVDIWIKKDDEVLKWKSFNINMPISIEYNINF